MKNISTVDTVTSISDSDTILVISGSDIKQITKSKLLSAVNTSLTTKSDISVSQASHTWGTLEKNNKQVTFHINISWNGVSNSVYYENKATVSSTYKPQNIVYGVLAILDGSSILKGYAHVKIDTSGNISFSSSYTHSGYYSYVGELSWYTS